MGKTFYWVGGATGNNALDKYNWNNPNNWVVQNVVSGGISNTTQGISSTTTTVSTTKNNAVNRFNVSTGSIGSSTDQSKTYCPGIGDFVIIGELPALGNNTPVQVKAPLLFGGCGITSGQNWASTTPYAAWENAAGNTGTGVNIGISTITIKNNKVANTDSVVYPYEWIGGGITGSSSEILDWVKAQNPGVDVESLITSTTSDLRLIVKDSVNTDIGNPYEMVNSSPIKVSLLFKAGVKQAFTLAGSPANIVKTKFFDTSSHIALGVFGGIFDSVEIKTNPTNSNHGPSTRYIQFGSYSVLNDVFVDRYAGNLYVDSSTYVNNINITNTSWYGFDRGIEQNITLECYLDGPIVRTALGYTVGTVTATESTLKVTPCTIIHPQLTRDGYQPDLPYSTAFPPTINLGLPIGETLIGDEQEMKSVIVQGQQYDLISYLDGRWHLCFNGSVNMNYLNANNCLVKCSQNIPQTAKVRIGNAEFKENSEITFTKACPIVNAGDKDVWYFGELTDTLRGGLKFLDTTGIVYGGKGIVIANTFEDSEIGIDSRSGSIDYQNTDIQATVTTQA